MSTVKSAYISCPRRTLPLLWLPLIGVLHIWFRISSIGHALTWDEAWILCSLKSLAGGGELFLHQLWRHPPLYMGFGLLLSPLEEGFAIRMQILSLGLSTVALLVFISFVSSLYGRRIGLLAGLVYTLLPGTLLFDTWIKRDGLVTLFCTLALWAFFKRKDLLAGVFLGLGMLSKETAVFFAASLALLIVFSRPRHQIIKTFIAVFLPTFLVSGWWYVFFHQGISGYTKFFSGISREAEQFAKPWWYYFAKLRYDLGFPGLLLLGTGILAIIPAVKRNNIKNWGKYMRLRLLPLFILLPAYLILSLSYGKPPWMTSSLYPFHALLIALGWVFLIRIFSDISAQFGLLAPKHFSALISLIIIPLFGYSALPFDYIGHLKKMSPTTVGVMKSSYEITEAVNKLTEEDEKLLLMPMIYRIGPTMPDPIFYWHLKPIHILRNNNLETSYDAFRHIIMTNKITWALLFPLDGSNQLDIYEKSVRDINAWGYKLTRGVLLRVDAFWKEGD